MPRPELEITDAPLDRSELAQAAGVATRAFLDDPFFCHLSPSRKLRERGLSIFWRATAGNLGPGGRLLTARLDGRIVGVAAWIAPGGYPYPAGAQARQLVGVVRALIPRPAALLSGWRYLDAIEKAHPKDELWYLAILATDPELQRSGVGTALVDGIHADCDQQGLDAYLETQKEDNLGYYRRFGYEVVDELHPVSDGPPLWTMRRTHRG